MGDIERCAAEPQYETHGTLAEMTAERDSWRRVAERLEQEKRDNYLARILGEGMGQGQ